MVYLQNELEYLLRFVKPISLDSIESFLNTDQELHMDFRQKYYLHEDIPVFWKTRKRQNSDKLQLVRSDRRVWV